jgi:hypothetical protein
MTYLGKKFAEKFTQEQNQIKDEKKRKLEILKNILLQKKKDMYNLPVDKRDDTLRPEFDKLVDVLIKLSNNETLTEEEEALFSNEEQKPKGGKRRKSRRNRKSKKSKKSRKNRKKSKRRSRR